MILDNSNAQKIAAHFKNKFQVVTYCGCWGSNSITFALYQDNTESAGVEITIERPTGDYLESVKVLNCKRLTRYAMDQDRQFRRSFLPIYIL